MQDGQQNGQQSGEPGWVYRPGDSIPSQPNEAPASQEVVQKAEEPKTGSMQTSGEQSDSPNEQKAIRPNPSLPHVEWTASEYIANPKTAGWFIVLALGSIVFAAAVYLLTKDIIPTIVIGILGIIVGIAGARQPRVLTYSINNTGLAIGEKFYPYASFKSFSLADDGAIGYISLLPLKRFMPPLTVHYDPQDEDKIVSTLAEYLPYEEHKKDVVDSISRRLRF